jgi:phosphatidylglycerophosphate synthase
MDKITQEHSGTTPSQRVFSDRKRTNILSKPEQKLILFLLPRIPHFINPNILTGIGISGSMLVLLAFILASQYHVNFLLLGILGLAINWFGDSLDGRIAYFRNISRKWYGFSLDIIMDWIGTVLIGLGYMVYAVNEYELFAFIFVVLYGWAMIISQLRYKITDQYTIDSGLVGPTEVRVLIATILILEVVFTGSIQYFVIIMCIALLIINISDTRKLLILGDIRDQAERQDKNG